ncbi:MAG TPA: dTDP-4-dehydrorhamnose reductase [Microbacteriaceae bacterium]|nr:dTDP-4-dehydrorhamnose reductase [Microbacteriaceae bacterium]
MSARGAGSVAVVGAGGMLGTDLVTALGDRATPITRTQLDVTDADAALWTLEGYDVIVNCAAWTSVDDVETSEAVASLAHEVNALGAEHLALAARAHRARFIQISTDYVFSGDEVRPYREDHPRNPKTAYGMTKASGEDRAIGAYRDGTAIVRTAWLYGEHGQSFPRTMLSLAAERDTVSVVTDQLGQPTWTADLAAQLVALIDAGTPAGIYHGTNAGETSWYGFARRIFELAGLDPERVQPTDSTAFVRPAPRPAYSVLGHDAWARVGLTPMRDWDAAITAAFASGAFD